MDISESYESQPQQQGEPQQQQMQCEASFSPTNGFGPLVGPVAGPAPAPSSMQIEVPFQQTTQEAAQQPVPGGADVDVDSLLLQKFSCMGTTDHDDLIKQFQTLMNLQMDRFKIQFFLEMSNWNLQNAIGCYLDFCSNSRHPPSMKIVQQSRPNEYQQVWRLGNDGIENWPSGCYLMSPSQMRRIEVPAIKPGESCDIIAELPASAPTILWHLCTPEGLYFGDTIMTTPPDPLCNTQAELAEKMSQLLVSSDSTNPETFPQINIVISMNME